MQQNLTVQRQRDQRTNKLIVSL